jgi:hypothetical protein
MARHHSREVSDRALQSGASRHDLIDLSIRFVVADETRDDDEREILSLGGVWDRDSKSWSGREAESFAEVGLAGDQVAAMDWIAAWFRAYFTGETMSPEIYSCLLLGGSRAGKTHLGIRATVAFAVAVPNSRVWMVQEAGASQVDEIEAELDDFLPRDWYKRKGDQYLLLNGARLIIRSAHQPKALKRGRCDFAFLNEAQNVAELAHSMLRMRTSDTGGLVLGAANPPNDDPAGQWVADYAEQTKAGRRPNSKVFPFDPRRNPHVKREQLEALKSEVDPRTYRIEVLGEIMAPSNAVYHSFSQIENISPTPELGDVTEEFAARIGLGQGVTDLVGMDFQQTPHHVAAVARAFANPEDARKPFVHFTGEIIVELGDEHDLSDRMYEFGLNPKTTAIVADASGAWQDGKHSGEGNSFDILRSLDWGRVHVPDKREKKNPPILERMKNDNRLFQAEDGSRIVHFDDEQCRELVEAVRMWRRKNGFPDRRSKWAHKCDAMSYLLWRCYPRKIVSRQTSYKRLKGRKRAAQMRGF